MKGIHYYQQETAEIQRRVRELDLHSSTLLRTPPPSYDPVFTTIFTSVFTSLNFSVAATAFLASAASAISLTALTPGIQIVRSK